VDAAAGAAPDADVARYLEHLRVERRLGVRSLALYGEAFERLHRWTRALMLTADAAELPAVLLGELEREFLIPQTAIRVWGVADAYRALAFSQGVSEDAKSFTSSLTMPYCGANSGFEASRWFEDGSSVVSMAMIPLRHGIATPAFGLLVLGSPDPTRYTVDMGTDFLMRIGEIASAGLTRLLPPP
jgi:uncharacterized protein YigA (DUF484 family)